MAMASRCKRYYKCDTCTRNSEHCTVLPRKQCCPISLIMRHISLENFKIFEACSCLTIESETHCQTLRPVMRLILCGTCGDTVGGVTALQAASSRYRFRVGSLEWPRLGPGVDQGSIRNE
jgi:hypothetical protein